MPHDFNTRVIEEFRARHGRVGGPFEGARLILLTTTGSRTGTPHTTPLGYLPDGDGRILVVASAEGSPRHPDWYRNILASPRVTVESGVFTYEADAVVLEGDERDRAFARAVEGDPGWAEYQRKTDHVLPVIALTELPASGPPRIKARSMGEAIRVVHDVFRRELILILEELTGAAERGLLGTQLRVNCLTLCQGLHNHHTGEDTMLFPHLVGSHPELAPTLTRLGEEHERIAALLEKLRQALTGDDPAHVRQEVERLTTALENHLTYEEAELVPVLDTIGT